jgi:hypothetical protein
MLLNADFSQRAIMRADGAVWSPSSSPGVTRRMLDRVGDEVARATSIVRYAPGSRFAEHKHEGGEEFIVLEGVFSDAGGDYPMGAYVRNPPGTAHAPWTNEGCVIFVKLCQMHEGDRAQLRIDTNLHPWINARMPLSEGIDEHVALLRAEAGKTFALGGKELLFETLVLTGAFEFEGRTIGPHDWLRLPAGEMIEAHALSNLTLWSKKARAPILI